MKIKDMPLVDQPRAKLVRYGPEKLSNEELLAVVVGSGQKGENALQIASKVLKWRLDKRSDMLSIESLQAYLGLGKAKASSILACFELGERLFSNKMSKLILSPSDVWAQLHDIRDQRREHFIVFFLDIRNQVIKREVVSIGTLTASLVHPREVFEGAVSNSAAQVILCHNHPSGITQPSEEDKKLTARLVSSGNILGIEVVDHIIVSKSSYFSFKENKLI